ncbi:peptidylprolyl isomerase [Anaeromyxobacter terrae]|uniref:peptidylprolyl isomerase n=1 Tax=Anaeromyxobacter terrae TaxID=2925406 RepID=UPI001F59AF0E|nr:peptidylprolyl isomerase [Anaeromyxobacter sp. SG22]
MTSAALPLLALLAAAPAAGPSPQIVDRVAGLVNGEVITLSELAERAGPALLKAEQLSPGPERDQAQSAALKRAFEDVIAERLLQSKAAELQLEATEQQIDEAVEDIKKRNNFDEPALDRALKEQGLDRATFRANVKREYDAFLVLQYQVRAKVKVSDDDLRNYYQSHPQEFGGEDEVKVRHIFLPVPDNATKAQEAKVQEQMTRVLQRLKTGEDFAAVAREVSKGPSAAEGGDLGWLRRGTIEKALEDAAFALKAGELSKPVRAGPGLHVFKVEERRVAGEKSFEDAKEEIRAHLVDQQAGTYRTQLIAELRRDALIEPKLPELQK